MTAPQSDFDISAFRGLPEEEAAERLARDGPNELPSERHHGLLSTILDVVHEPMLLLLLGCAAVYFFLGDPGEASILLGMAFGVVGITIVQERRTERALESLRDLSSPRALAIRSGRARRVAGREVVVGDAVVLSEGDRVPADGAVRACQNLTVDESLLTGESAAVWKSVRDSVFSGTLVTKGRGVVEVLATGARAEIGKIGKSLASLSVERTPVQKEVRRLVLWLGGAGAVLCVAVGALYAFSGAGALKGALAGLTLAMSMLPEEFPVVLTVFLALGAWRISRRRVLTRRVPVVETLGSATVLCVDKTGTLTQNRMEVRKVYAEGRHFEADGVPGAEFPEAFHRTAEFSILASQKDPFDAMEIAFKAFGERHLSRPEHPGHLHRDWTLVREYPLSDELLALSHVWRSPEGSDYVIAAKGAPEAIADLCHLDPARQAEAERVSAAMAGEGLRVLGVASAAFRQPSLPSIQHDFDFEFLGLIGLADPVRPGVPEAIRECREAGIRVIMITGDHPATARAVAREIGLPGGDPITGAELERMDEAELRRRLRGVSVFARVVPEQKLRLIGALKANGEVVAMTGDGVNDAPALKAAHIGIAMGSRGSDVAREAAALVLLDDDFGSIVEAVRLGRRIFDNLRKATAYVLSVHVPIAGMSLFPLLLGWPFILLPVHIAFLEMIIDPTCTIAFEVEPEAPGLMRRRPRGLGERLLGWRLAGYSLLQGAFALAAGLLVLGWALERGLGEAQARTMAFTAIISASLGLMLAHRAGSGPLLPVLRAPNAASWIVFAGAALFLGAVIGMPFLRGLFHFAPLPLPRLAAAAAAGAASVLWLPLLHSLQPSSEPPK